MIAVRRNRAERRGAALVVPRNLRRNLEYELRFDGLDYGSTTTVFNHAVNHRWPAGSIQSVPTWTQKVGCGGFALQLDGVDDCVDMQSGFLDSRARGTLVALVWFASPQAGAGSSRRIITDASNTPPHCFQKAGLNIQFHGNIANGNIDTRIEIAGGWAADTCADPPDNNPAYNTETYISAGVLIANTWQLLGVEWGPSGRDHYVGGRKIPVGAFPRTLYAGTGVANDPYGTKHDSIGGFGNSATEQAYFKGNFAFVGCWSDYLGEGGHAELQAARTL